MTRRAAVLIFLLLAVLHLWPLSWAPWRLALHRNDDTMVSEYLVSWIAHVLPRAPSHVFDPDIFAPERGVLTYGDPLIVPGLLAAPVRWLGGSPVLAFNLVTLAGLVLTAYATWRLARAWFGDGRAALVAGALGAFNVHMLARLPHLPATHLWPVPAALYFSDLVITEGRPRQAVALTGLVVITAATSLYTLALVMIVIALAGLSALLARDAAAATFRSASSIDGVVTPLRRVAVLAGSMAAGLVVALPVLLPYLRFAAAGNTRPIEMVRQFSATPAGYLSSTSVVDRLWTSGFYRDDVNALFAGVVALALAAVGLWQWRSVVVTATDATTRRRGWTLVLIAVVGVVLSLGPATPIYRALYDVFPPLRGLRVAARFGYLYLVVVAVAAGAGARWLIAQRTWTHTGLTAMTAMLVGLVTVEAWQGPQPVVPFTGVSRLYAEIARAPDPVLLVEVPFYPPEGVHENGEYVLAATAHWRPLANGYSGFTPDSYRRRTETFWFFPEDRALAAFRDAGVTHVMVHLERFGAERPAVERTLAMLQDLTLLGSDGLGHRLYVVKR